MNFTWNFIWMISCWIWYLHTLWVDSPDVICTVNWGSLILLGTLSVVLATFTSKTIWIALIFCVHLVLFNGDLCWPYLVREMSNSSRATPLKLESLHHLHLVDFRSHWPLSHCTMSLVLISHGGTRSSQSMYGSPFSWCI